MVETRASAIARADRSEKQRERDLLIYHHELDKKNKYIDEIEEELAGAKLEAERVGALMLMSKSAHAAEEALKALRNVEHAASVARGVLSRWMP